MSKPSLAREFLASLVVFLVALPLCMGIALASGLPPAAGLISGMVAGLVIGTMAGCPLQVSGPAAGLVAVVWESVQRFGLESLGVIVILAALIQIIVGYLGLASMFRAMSPAVIQGGLSGLGALIAASQFHVMLDAKPESNGLANLLTIPQTLYKGIFPMDGSTHHLAAFIGLIAIITMMLWSFAPARLRVIPAPLVAVVIAMAVAQVFQFPIQYISIPDNLFSTLNPVSPDYLSLLNQPGVWFAAFSIAFVATIETVLTMVAVERMKPGEKANFNQELKAQGFGNLVCGALGVLPVAGVIIRSSANINAGAQTRLPAVLHGIWMLLPAVFFPVMLESIPVSVLAALLVYTGCRLINLNSINVLRTYGNAEVGIFLATMIATVLFNLLTGILVGMVLSILKLVYRFTQLDIQQAFNKDEGSWQIELSGAATFMRLPRLVSHLSSVQSGQKVILHLGNLAYIDPACLEFLMGWEKQLIQTGGNVIVNEGASLVSVSELGCLKGDIQPTKPAIKSQAM